MALSWTSGRLENFRMTSARNESVHPTPAGSGTLLRASASGGTICGHHLTGPHEGPEGVLLSSPLSRPSNLSRVGPQSVCCSPRSGSRWRRE